MTNITIAATESDTDDFTAVLNLPASPETVMALFTSATGVTCWWGATEGDGAVGGTLITRFGDNGVNAMRVIESTPTRVVWEPIAVEGTKPTGHTKEWLGTTVEFDVAAVGTGSRLRFRHAGLTPRLACWDDCNSAWTMFMGSIRTYAETGTGTPYLVCAARYQHQPHGLVEAVDGTRSTGLGTAGAGRPEPPSDPAPGQQHRAPCRPDRLDLHPHPAGGQPAHRRAEGSRPAHRTRDGTRRLYTLHHESLEPVRELLSEFWPDALGRKEGRRDRTPTTQEAIMTAEIRDSAIVATEHIKCTTGGRLPLLHRPRADHHLDRRPGRASP